MEELTRTFLNDVEVVRLQATIVRLYHPVASFYA